MTRDELLEQHLLLCRDARELMKRKNADYAGRDGAEPFANFTRTEAMGICSTERGMLVRMTDKMSRLSSFCEAGRFSVQDEGLRDTIIDIVNYSVLLWAYLKDKGGETDKYGLPVFEVSPLEKLGVPSSDLPDPADEGKERSSHDEQDHEDDVCRGVGVRRTCRADYGCADFVRNGFECSPRCCRSVERTPEGTKPPF
jgi:hypothetical protein